MTKSKTTWNNLNELVVELIKNDKADKETAVMVLENLITELLIEYVPKEQREQPNKLIEEYSKKAKEGNFKYVSGMFGWWAKSKMKLR